MASSLPTEMIQAILFELCINPDEHVATALAVSSGLAALARRRACHTLRWSTFAFCLPAYDESMLSAFFERSRPEPLNITISFDLSNADSPARTHITCTDLKPLTDIYLKMTYLCIKGVPGHPNILEGYELVAVLTAAQALTELVIDGVSLRNASGAVTTPHLRTLSLRRSESFHGTVRDEARELAGLLQMLDAPALASLTIYDLHEHLADLLVRNGVCFPIVTHLCVVPGSYESLFDYPSCLPGVEELVLRGSDPELYAIGGLWYEDWLQMRTVDLSQLEPPPTRCLPIFWENLYDFARERVQSDSPSRMLVRLPPGILPENSYLDVAHFMDLRPA